MAVNVWQHFAFWSMPQKTRETMSADIKLIKSTVRVKDKRPVIMTHSVRGGNGWGGGREEDTSLC